MGAGAAAAAATTGVTDAEAAMERRGAAGEDDAREAVDVEVEGEEEEEEVEAAAAAAAREGTRQRGVATTLDIVEERARRDIVVFGNSRPPDPICIEEELPVTRVERRVRLDGEVREEATRKRRIEWSCSFFLARSKRRARTKKSEERSIVCHLRASLAKAFRGSTWLAFCNTLAHFSPLMTSNRNFKLKRAP